MRNLWKATTSTTGNYRGLSGTVAVDVGIVGGGYTGCSTALHCARLGMSTAVLEARTIGYGCSGRNSGNLNPGLWTLPGDVVRHLGEKQGAALNRMLRGGPGYVKELVDTYHIDCELTTSGTLHCAATSAGRKELKTRFAALKAEEHDVDFLDSVRTKDCTGSTAFSAAIANRSAAWIQPYAYLHGLAGAAASQGALIFENSPVNRVVEQNGAWMLETPGGRVLCRKLLIATGAYHADLAFGAAADYSPLWYFNFATEPLTAAKFDHILPGREGCWDTSKVMVSFTRDLAGRFVIGSVGRLDRVGRRVHSAWARRKMALLFPALAGKDLEYGWHGRISMTADHLPKVVSLGNGAISIFGYNGRGIAPGTVFGRAAAQHFATGDADAFGLSITKPSRSRLNTLRSAYARLGSLAFHLVDARTGPANPRLLYEGSAW